MLSGMSGITSMVSDMFPELDSYLRIYLSIRADYETGIFRSLPVLHVQQHSILGSCDLH